jgi:hypothetical protein
LNANLLPLTRKLMWAVTNGLETSKVYDCYVANAAMYLIYAGSFAFTHFSDPPEVLVSRDTETVMSGGDVYDGKPGLCYDR